MQPDAFERSFALPDDFGVAKGRDLGGTKTINNVTAAHRPVLSESKRMKYSKIRKGAKAEGIVLKRRKGSRLPFQHRKCAAAHRPDVQQAVSSEGPSHPRLIAGRTHKRQRSGRD